MLEETKRKNGYIIGIFNDLRAYITTNYLDEYVYLRDLSFDKQFQSEYDDYVSGKRDQVVVGRIIKPLPTEDMYNDLIDYTNINILDYDSALEYDKDNLILQYIEVEESLEEIYNLNIQANLLLEDRGYIAPPLFFSEDDIYVNYDKWLDESSHILFVTGVSASGKSTLAKKLADKFKAKYVEIDIISFALRRENRANWDYIKSAKDSDAMLYKYMKEKNLQPDFILKICQKYNIDKKMGLNDALRNEVVKYVNWLLDRSERCVVEASCLAHMFKYQKEWQKFPIIFKGTSIMKSIFRRIKRNGLEKLNKDGIFAFIEWFLSVAPSYQGMYKDQKIGRKTILPNNDYEFVKEGYIFDDTSDKGNFQTHNIQKWLDGKEKIAYVLGPSGSGKTTLAHFGKNLYSTYQQNPEPVKVISLDEIHRKLNKEHPELHGNPKKWEYLLKAAYRELGDSKGIIEGEQLRNVWDKIKTKPVIIMGTSALKSSFRMVKRTLGQYDTFKDYAKEKGDNSIFAPAKKMISVIAKNTIKNFKNENQYGKMRSDIDDMYKKDNMNKLKTIMKNKNDDSGIKELEKQEKSVHHEDYKMNFIFYHGSPEKYNKLEPVSPNLGNRWEPPKWVTYMWKNPENAIKWGLQAAIGRNKNKIEPDRIIVIGDGENIQLYTTKDRENGIRQSSIGLPFYVYTIQIKPDTLGVGHATGLDEYTSTDPKPKIISCKQYRITEKIINDYIIFLDSEEEYKTYYDQALNAPLRGDLSGLMWDQNEVFEKERFIKHGLRDGRFKPGDDLELILKEYRRN